MSKQLQNEKVKTIELSRKTPRSQNMSFKSNKSTNLWIFDISKMNIN